MVGIVLDGRYRIEAPIARGGMSTVYRGTDLRLDRPVAVKVMDPQLAADPQFRTRFEFEARAVAKLNHPGLVAVYDRGGQVLVVDPEGGHWVKFVVTRVPASPEKPHGLDYSLTLHGPSGERLVGFDNAHPVGRGRRGEPLDHRHRIQIVKPYAYEDAATLLADFWQAVDAVLKERGVL